MSELDALSHKHMAMVELALAGATNNEIARQMEMTASRVSIILRSGLFQDELARRRKQQNHVHDQASAGSIGQAKKAMEESALAAAQVHINLMTTSLDPKVKQVSATEILRRTFDRVHGVGGAIAGPQAVQLNINQLQVLQVALREAKELDEKRTPLVEQSTEAA